MYGDPYPARQPRKQSHSPYIAGASYPNGHTYESKKAPFLQGALSLTNTREGTATPLQCNRLSDGALCAT